MTFAREALLRLARGFLAHHLGRLRGSDPVEDQGWPDGLPLSEPPVLADSLERVTLAGLFADAFGIREAGLEDLLLARPSVERYADLLQRAWRDPPQNLVFFTSGSTGNPKPINHSWRNLVEEVNTLCPRLEQLLSTPPSRVVSLVPPHHIYGFLWTFLYPALNGLPVVQQSPVAVRFQEGDIVVAAPVFIRTWKARQLPLPEGVRILVSTAPFPHEDAQWLSRQTAWLEIYGSTETGGIGTRTEIGSAFELLPYWQPRPSAETGGAFDLMRAGGTVALPDQVEVNGRFVTPIGRRDGAVQVAGVNVFPQKVKEFLEKQPGVAAAAVRLGDSPQGPRLKALVVPQPEQDNSKLEKALRESCGAGLTSVERPVRFTFSSTLPTNAMGKALDWD